MGLATFKRSFLPFLIFYQCQPYNYTVYIPTATLLGHFDCSFLLCICLCLGHPQRPNLELKNTRGQG